MESRRPPRTEDMLTDFVVAVESDAVAVAGAVPSARTWPRFTGKDMDEVKLGRLWGVVRRGSDERPLRPFRLLHAVSDDGPWVFSVPQALVERVGALDDAGLERAAGAWAACEEF